jgi:hypothetical protein
LGLPCLLTLLALLYLPDFPFPPLCMYRYKMAYIEIRMNIMI